MGWNTGYTIFESTVIGAYDLGKLDKAMLTVLMEPYRDSDIDSGGSADLRTKDGKDVEQVVIETWGFLLPAEPEGDGEEYEKWGDEKYELFRKVTKHFNWC